MKALFLCLFLTACSCVQVSHSVTVVAKGTEPARTGVCMAMKVGNITTYMPMQGGVCAGVIEMIPAHYSLSLSDGTEREVDLQVYDRTWVGEKITYSTTECK